MLSTVDNLIRLAPCDGMAGIGRRSFISGWNNRSRSSCSQSPIIRTSKMARYTSCDSSRDILYPLQYLLCKKATTCRRLSRGCAYPRTLRNYDSAVDFGTEERCSYRTASIYQRWQLDTMGVAFMIGLLTSLGSMLGFDCAVHMGEFVPYILQKGRS